MKTLRTKLFHLGVKNHTSFVIATPQNAGEAIPFEIATALPFDGFDTAHHKKVITVSMIELLRADRLRDDD